MLYKDPECLHPPAFFAAPSVARSFSGVRPRAVFCISPGLLASVIAAVSEDLICSCFPVAIARIHGGESIRQED